MLSLTKLCAKRTVVSSHQSKWRKYKFVHFFFFLPLHLRSWLGRNWTNFQRQPFHKSFIDVTMAFKTHLCRLRWCSCAEMDRHNNYRIENVVRKQWNALTITTTTVIKVPAKTTQPQYTLDKRVHHPTAPNGALNNVHVASDFRWGEQKKRRCAGSSCW